MVTRSPHFYFQEEQDNIRKIIKPNVTSFPVLAYPSENPQNVFGSAPQKLAAFQQLLNTSLLFTQAQREHERFCNTLLVYQQNLLDSITINSLQNFKPLIPELKPHHLEAYKTTPSVAATPTAYSNSPAPTQLSDEIESDSINKSAKVCSIPKLFEEKTVEARPKTVQSKFKNCYGLCVGRVIKSVKECLRIMGLKGSKGIPENSPYYYIYQVISQLSDFELECFEEYLKGYHTRRPEIKKNRGKSVVYNYLEEGKGHGLVLVGLVISFLETKNKDLQSYINNTTKHKSQVCQVLSNEKDLAQLRNTFRQMQCELKQKMEN